MNKASYIKIDAGQDDFLFFNNELIRKGSSMKMEVLKKVIFQVLGREGTMEDAKDFSLVTHALYPGREWITYRDKHLGDLRGFQSEQEDGQWIVGFEFIPGDYIK